VLLCSLAIRVANKWRCAQQNVAQDVSLMQMILTQRIQVVSECAAKYTKKYEEPRHEM
jgi:hypothetical protein